MAENQEPGQGAVTMIVEPGLQTTAHGPCRAYRLISLSPELFATQPCWFIYVSLSLATFTHNSRAQKL